MLKDMYKQFAADPFPAEMEIAFRDAAGERIALSYHKVQFDIDGQQLGLRYGENPDQPASLYRLTNGNITLGDVQTVQPGLELSSRPELLQSGKHPSKINITDVDSALQILKYLSHAPACVIMKHNNPSGAAIGSSVEEAFTKALYADRIAAFGGAVAINRTLDKAAAEAIMQGYVEVVAAPEFADGVLEILSRRKNLRVLRIAAMDRLETLIGQPAIELRSLIDGGMVVQTGFQSSILSADDFLPAETSHKGAEYRVERQPTRQELDDMLFGWLVETGVTSNSVIYVKDGATVGIGTGEQDRVGVAEIARDKAYRKLADRYAFLEHGKPVFELSGQELQEVNQRVAAEHGGLKGAVMISDAFFPFRDGAEVGLREGVSAIVQPGGSLRDYEVIQAVNEYQAAMVFTGQRSFRH
ncbi:AICAR transformylase/IMP cyclohydrolase PurH [Spirochaeta africana]|uniref:AICAR transformylase/IMP cyclohydrolase PurH n=1 Tax=Spirochaeta africana (strain ATCC 700263 / DSM 8902 / Z-7692) TaxID=889378 RepID=H9UJI1_SPIAZ|nr:AICAR transformylase/IMP cyclohydrolase PurH [Spirochaeta africana]AFG37674.1 AICAR transformylase/IMP cyclohydrolase PurH [Spirochaeta africana DSM 8902]